MRMFGDRCNEYTKAVDEFVKTHEDESLEEVYFVKSEVEKIIKKTVEYINDLKNVLISVKKQNYSHYLPSQENDFKATVEQLNIKFFYIMLSDLSGFHAVAIANKKLDSYDVPKLQLSEIENAVLELDEAIKVFNDNKIADWPHKLYTSLEILNAVNNNQLNVTSYNVVFEYTK